MSIDSQIMRLLAEYDVAVRLAAVAGFCFGRDIPRDIVSPEMGDVVALDNRVSEIRERFRALYAPLTASAGGKNVSK